MAKLTPEEIDIIRGNIWVIEGNYFKTNFERDDVFKAIMKIKKTLWLYKNTNMTELTLEEINIISKNLWIIESSCMKKDFRRSDVFEAIMLIEKTLWIYKE